LVAELATVQRIDALYQLVQAQKGVDASSSFTSAQRWAGVRSVRAGTVAMGVLLLCWNT
jgi:hypothetical protein